MRQVNCTTEGVTIPSNYISSLVVTSKEEPSATVLMSGYAYSLSNFHALYHYQVREPC